MSNKTSGLRVQDDAVLITLKNLPYQTEIIARIFEAFAQRDINIDLICQTPQNNEERTHLSFSVYEKDLPAVLAQVAEFRRKNGEIRVDASTGNTKISVCFEPMRDTPGIAAKIFRALADVGTEIKLISTSEIDVSLLISSQDEDKTVAKLSEVFVF